MKNGYKILKKQRALWLAALVSILLASCNVKKKVKEGEYFLDENHILCNTTEIPTEEIEPYIRQQTNRYLITLNFKRLNRKIELFPYHLWLYNSIDPDKMQKHKEERDKEYDEINEKRKANADAKNKKRIAKGRQPKPPKLKDKTEPTWRESWLQSGEPPALLDSMLIRSSREQIQRFLFSKGYFKAKVRDSVKVEPKRREAEVFYILKAGLPTHVRRISYEIEDKRLEHYVLQDSIHSLLHHAMRYDADVLTKERDRVVRLLRDNGYYRFGPESIIMNVDTNIAGDWLDIQMNIKKFAYRPEENNDTLLFVDHTQYYIQHIYVITDYEILRRNQSYKDTAVYHDVQFLYNDFLRFRKKDIANKILFSKGALFNYDIVEETYNRLSALKAFKSINVTFKIDQSKHNQLDCYILMSPMLKQNFSIETEGTNTSGNLGMAAAFAYQNRNTFKGSELLEVKLRGGLIAQKNFNTEEQDNTFGIPLLKSFNTVQFGPEINLNVPKPLFPFTLIDYYSNAQPRTIIGTSLNFQQNNRYARTLSSINYGLEFNGKQYTRHQVVPLEVNFIQAFLSESFSRQLEQTGNLFLINSFASHVTTVSRYSFMFNNQVTDPKQQYRTFLYMKTNLESSGNILRAFHDLSGEKKDSLGRYYIFDMPYAHFLRGDLDVRTYKSVKKLGRFVFRTYGGMGYALTNLNVLPYEKSFFAGGPNSVRAWKARTLGPGSYNGTFVDADGVVRQDINFDRLGDIQLEANLEYRFVIYKFLNGALFIDAGNIWLRQKNANKVNGEFDPGRFYKEIAIGTGLGLRADFSFFIIRIDGAFQTYNPANPEKERWMFGRGFFPSFITNFGIGYPF